MKIKNVMTLFVAVVCFGTVFTSCNKDEFKDCLVYRDGVGAPYLEVGENRYKVCNESKLDGYDQGEYVSADFDEISECDSDLSNQGVKLDYDSYIEIKSIEDANN